MKCFKVFKTLILENTISDEDDTIIVFHGSPKKFDIFKPPSETNYIASKEFNRNLGYDYIYCSENIDDVLQYAVRENGIGYIYSVEIPSNTPTLRELRKKLNIRAGTKSPVQDRVRVVLPSKIKILSIVKVEKKRGKKPKITPL